jgi:hypothetical protein
MHPVETGEIDICLVENINGSNLEDKIVERVDIVYFPIGNTDHNGDVAPEIQKGVELHRSFVFSELGPGKYRETEIDGCGIEGIYGIFQLQAEVFVRIQLPGDFYQYLSEVGVDSPVAVFVGMSQSISWDVAPDAHVIQLRLRHTKACLYVSKTFPIRELGEGHAEKLIQTGKRYHFVVAVVTIYALAKMERWNEIHDLRKNGFADIHD